LNFRVSCIALAMLSANRYVTRNGTFDPYHVSLQVRSAINHPKGCLEPEIPL
jgi:hypothetical protein